MQLSTAIATAIAPLVGGAIWWLFQYPGRKVRERMAQEPKPWGYWRRLLLSSVNENRAEGDD